MSKVDKAKKIQRSILQGKIEQEYLGIAGLGFRDRISPGSVYCIVQSYAPKDLMQHYQPWVQRVIEHNQYSGLLLPSIFQRLRVRLTSPLEALQTANQNRPLLHVPFIELIRHVAKGKFSAELQIKSPFGAVGLKDDERIELSMPIEKDEFFLIAQTFGSAGIKTRQHSLGRLYTIELDLYQQHATYQAKRGWHSVDINPGWYRVGVELSKNCPLSLVKRELGKGVVSLPPALAALVSSSRFAIKGVNVRDVNRVTAYLYSSAKKTTPFSA